MTAAPRPSQRAVAADTEAARVSDDNHRQPQVTGPQRQPFERVDLVPDNTRRNGGAAAGTTEEQYEIVVVRHGELRTTCGHVFLNYDDYGEPDAPFTLSYYFWVIRNAHRCVVVDTGYSERGATRRGRTILTDPRAALGALGLSPASDCTVVVSHAHYDHLGNLDYFTAAPVVIARAEYDFWTSGRSEHRLFRNLVDEEDLAALRHADARGRLRLVDERTWIAPGIELIPAPGHTPGQLMVAVRTSEGTVLLTSDAVHFDEELERGMPFRHMCDIVGAFDSFDLIASLRRSGHADILVTGHEPEVMHRFLPVSGLEEHAVVVAPLDRAPSGTR